jgi:hypothetical protein
VDVTIDDVLELKDTIIPLLENYKTQIENCAINETYKI